MVAGRARATVTYSDGTEHVASYFVLPPLDQHVTQYGTFMSETAWYDCYIDDSSTFFFPSTLERTTPIQDESY